MKSYLSPLNEAQRIRIDTYWNRYLQRLDSGWDASAKPHGRKRIDSFQRFIRTMRNNGGEFTDLRAWDWMNRHYHGSRSYTFAEVESYLRHHRKELGIEVKLPRERFGHNGAHPKVWIIKDDGSTRATEGMGH